MGQSLTRLPDLPDTETRSTRANRGQPPHQRQRIRRSLSDIEADNVRPSLHHGPRKPTRPGEERRDLGRRRPQVLRETNGNSHRTRPVVAPESRKQDHRSSQAREGWREERAASHQVHRTRKAEKHRETPTPRTRTSHHETRPARHRERQPKPGSKRDRSRMDVIELNDLGPTKDCVGCTESRAVRHFPSRTPTSECVHEINTCRRCLRRWIRTQFETKVWNQIQCPECGVHMQYEGIRDFAPENIFRRYDQLSTKAALEAIPGFTWCIAQGCKSGQVHEGTLTPKFRCEACKFSHCIVHQTKWHKNETCAEYDYRTDTRLKKAEEDASKKLVKSMAKKCPGCKRNIEKFAGCDHMRCSKCRTEFCWSCLALYGPIRKEGNHMHRPGCQHFGEV